jgi:hypothetical protein
VGLRTWLGLKRQPGFGQTVRRWPSDLAEDYQGPIVTFGIPLKSARTSKDWGQTQALLGATLRSIFRQSDQRWRILICGHEMPEIPEMVDSRIEFIASRFRPPPLPRPGHVGKSREDKYQKRIIMGLRVAAFGAGYFMDLDADDLVHRDLVATALETEHGCVITKGYVCDAASNAIAPVPGMITVEFDRICGSMAVVRYGQSDYPSPERGNIRFSNFARAADHAYLRGSREEIGKPLAVVPFAAAVYMVNTDENLSFVEIRSSERAAHLLSLVRAHAVTEPEKLRELSEQLGWVASSSA